MHHFLSVVPCLSRLSISQKTSSFYPRLGQNNVFPEKPQRNSQCFIFLCSPPLSQMKDATCFFHEFPLLLHLYLSWYIFCSDQKRAEKKPMLVSAPKIATIVVLQKDVSRNFWLFHKNIDISPPFTYFYVLFQQFTLSLLEAT